MRVTQPPPTTSKILELAELAVVVADLKAAGKTVVMCHGVFDLLHVGHIRHFKEAKSLADVLVVTLTEDRHVNKGPHRPAFTESLRAEALAALELVDFVAVSRHPTAINALHALQPTIYVKGPDYREAANDITGGIDLEETAVRAGGGRIHFTSGETFSSSNLLNRYVPSFPPGVEAYLADFRSKYSAQDVIECLDRLRSLKVIVCGEAILDEYVYCDQMGKSAKDPVLAMRYHSREVFAGGALGIANHIANFCKSVELVTALGISDGQESFVRNHLRPNVRANFIYKSDSPTIVKRRYVEKTLHTKLFEVYVINDDLLTPQEDEQLCEMLEARLTNADAIVASDFGHGLMTPNAISLVGESGKFLAVNTQINAANIRFHAISSYKRADYVCINEGELRLDARNRTAPVSDLIADLRTKLRCERFLVTRGSSGSMYFEGAAEYPCPSLTTSVVDRVGSGDAVLALSSLCAKTDVPGDMIAFIANVIGAQKVQIMGNRSAVDRVSTIKFIEALLK